MKIRTRIIPSVALMAAIQACSNAQQLPSAPSSSAAAPRSAGSVAKSRSQGFSVIYQFSGYQNGEQPEANLTIDAAGNLYGTASLGGYEDYGTVFKITPQGKETTIYSFNGANLVQPDADVIMDAQGNLYGVTQSGGGPSPGSGGVYEIKTDGTEVVLHAFSGGADGNFSFSDLIIDAAGNIYGTASEGGYFKGECAQVGVGCGVVFKVTPSHKYTVLYAFHGTDGSEPYAGLTMDSGGNLYGTTSFGGKTGFGTVFKLDPSGHESVLYNFTKGADGGVPVSGVVLDGQHNIYGTTQYGGFAGNQACDDGCGVVFEVNASGKETILHTFTSTPDGQFPLGTLVLTSSNILYGTTQYGGTGSKGAGTVYELATSGKQYHIVHSFMGTNDGSQPVAGLAIDLQQTLAGVTQFGDDNSGEGAVVYSIKQKQSAPALVHR
ncbi:MAG: hypothetical protein JOZ77_03355 [Candidatus Eremiobacteraeota bacterium]|nr:hypothetical protein [Candidatus Eremiobacteraeota bacterium]